MMSVMQKDTKQNKIKTLPLHMKKKNTLVCETSSKSGSSDTEEKSKRKETNKKNIELVLNTIHETE